MPGDRPARTGRNEDSRVWRRKPRRPFRQRHGISLIALAAALLPSTLLAQETRTVAGLGISVGTLEVIQLAMLFGVMGAALLSAIWLIRERARTADENVYLRNKVAELDAAVQRADALINTRDQKIVIWQNSQARPEIVGSLPLELGVPEERAAFLAFGRWLSAISAAPFERAVLALREKGINFELIVETQGGVLLVAEGRRSAGSSVVRFASISESQRGYARLQLDHQRLLEEHANFLGLVEAIPMPFWLRSAEGRLRYVNKAYAGAVEADSPAAVVAEAREFLGTTARSEIEQGHLSSPVYQNALSTVIGGDRRIYRVTDYAGPSGSAGLAVDISETESVKLEYERLVKSHSETLDQLTTAVAIFDDREKLRFYNQAFQKLWNLDPAYLESAPEHALLLDRLRSEGSLPEQPEWRRWKEQLLSAYRAVQSNEQLWYLPDGRVLRVIANPQPNGGVTWVFENLTERMDLESRYQTAVRVQGETLDNLAEGVAVFGPDGRLRLSNPAFAMLWGLPAELVRQGAHISDIRTACAGMTADRPWDDFVAAATGFDDERQNRQGQIELESGVILRHAVIHLPNGQVMMTFVDVTDSVNVERALKEKNEALQWADQLKNDFVQNVSYELRSPLTNIMGFTELLNLPDTGQLNQRQGEYVDHIASSSAVLLAIVNDILDLATVDAGIMELDIAEVPIGPVIDEAVRMVAERFDDHGIGLSIDLSGAPATFFADGSRVRQILFNLLSNAGNFAPDGSTVTLAVRERDEAIEFVVHDTGPGMPPEILQSIFRRFEPHLNGGRRRGAGLGLSIVKSFMELHGGTVSVETEAGRGTTVTCRFPVAPHGLRVAAE